MTYKVIQWATGSVGAESLRHIITRPDLELVGVYTYGDKKDGVDAGEIAGMDPVGVLASNDRDAVLGLDADIVVHASSMFHNGRPVVEENDTEVEQMLRAGLNVTSVAGYIWPRVRGAEVEARLSEACAAGGSTLYGTGINPGFFLERIGPMLTGLCQRVDHVSVLENWDATNYPSPEILFDLVGLGLSEEAISPDLPGLVMIGEWFNEALAYVAHVLGGDVQRFERSLDYGLATRDIQLPAGTIKKGTVAALAQTWSGIVDGRPLVSVTDRWVADWDIPGWGDERSHYWQVEVEGVPGVRGKFDFTDSYPTHTGAPEVADRITPGTTSAAAVNAIPAVVAAPPGILAPIPFATCPAEARGD